tara:strand:+ start:275 stop:505 length:231 start_codon:yes stop_codon:yes gene_type:complete
MAKTNKDGLKPGWQSTEFILSTLVALLGIAVAGGFVDLDNGATAVDKVAGLIASALAALGYSLSRGKVKAAAEENK